MIVVGVDGCPAGWIGARVDLARGLWAAAVYPTFAALLDAHADATTIAVDVPIGLSEDGPRACDRLARALLGPRRSSVFDPPSRRLLALIGAASYPEANALARRELGHGIGVQAFNIFGKIREVDALMTPALLGRVREAHPELCFSTMRGGSPCQHPKRTPAGAEERLEALRASCAWLGADVPRPPRGAARDDLLDALAAAWTAERVAAGRATEIPSEPQLDPRGLRMEMVA